MYRAPFTRVTLHVAIFILVYVINSLTVYVARHSEIKIISVTVFVNLISEDVASFATKR